MILPAQPSTTTWEAVFLTSPVWWCSNSSGHQTTRIEFHLLMSWLIAQLLGPLRASYGSPLVLTSHSTTGLEGPLGQPLPRARTHLKVENFLLSSVLRYRSPKPGNKGRTPYEYEDPSTNQEERRMEQIHSSQPSEGTNPYNILIMDF
ncbi:uncharacterized protein RBU33_007993 isoform 1-T1 [Hipposideros larvatus]